MSLPNWEKKYNEMQENEIKKVTGLITVASGFTLELSNIYKQGKHYWGYIIIKKNSDYYTNIQDNVGVLKKTPKFLINSGCFTSNDLWTSLGVGYFFVGTDGQMYIADHGNKQHNYAKAFIDFVTD